MNEINKTSHLKTWIKDQITRYVRDYEKREDICTVWGEPQVGFADASHPYIMALKDLIGESHGLPQDVLPDATIVIAYFLPFTKELADTNKALGTASSPEWAQAYEETNAMIGKLNECLIEKLAQKGYVGAVSPEASSFDQVLLKSNWSHRHMAYAAGLGTFGINNMLITRVGGCGRYGTLVTNLDIEPDAPLKEEQCLYKKNGTCGVCVRRCPSGALTLDGYDRKKCYGICKENAARYTMFGSSYTEADGTTPNSVGSEVCGKCVVGVPCAFRK